MELSDRKSSVSSPLINGINGRTRRRPPDTFGYVSDSTRRFALEQARRHGLNQDDAEDAASRWLLELSKQEQCQQPETYRPPDDAAYWRFATKRFIRRDAAQTGKHARREICYTALTRSQVSETDSADFLLEESAQDTRDIPDMTWEQVHCAAFWNDVLGALASLPPAQRQAFLWRHVDDAPIPVIAARLGRTEEATRQLLHRARLSLREPLADWAKNIFLFLLFFTVTQPILTRPYVLSGKFHHSPHIHGRAGAGGYRGRKVARK